MEAGLNGVRDCWQRSGDGGTPSGSSPRQVGGGGQARGRGGRVPAVRPVAVGGRCWTRAEGGQMASRSKTLERCNVRPGPSSGGVELRQENAFTRASSLYGLFGRLSGMYPA